MLPSSSSFSSSYLYLYSFVFSCIEKGRWNQFWILSHSHFHFLPSQSLLLSLFITYNLSFWRLLYHRAREKFSATGFQLKERHGCLIRTVLAHIWLVSKYRHLCLDYFLPLLERLPASARHLKEKQLPLTDWHHFAFSTFSVDKVSSKELEGKETSCPSLLSDVGMRLYIVCVCYYLRIGFSCRFLFLISGWRRGMMMMMMERGKNGNSHTHQNAWFVWYLFYDWLLVSNSTQIVSCSSFSIFSCQLFGMLSWDLSSSEILTARETKKLIHRKLFHSVSWLCFDLTFFVSSFLSHFLWFFVGEWKEEV